jgi:hypothetical protein
MKGQRVKVFRLDEATALLDVVRPLVDDLICMRRDAAIKLLEAQTAKTMVSDATGAHRAALQERQAHELQAALVALIERIESHGCIVKDVGMGLLDFPALRSGQLVNLCWKAGEPSITFWHGVDEGFAARKPISRRRR